MGKVLNVSPGGVGVEEKDGVLAKLAYFHSIKIVRTNDPLKNLRGMFYHRILKKDNLFTSVPTLILTSFFSGFPPLPGSFMLGHSEMDYG